MRYSDSVDDAKSEPVFRPVDSAPEAEEQFQKIHW
jgi:hypothetical protein